MTREVEVVINGLHMDSGEENTELETVTRAEYFKKNDSHYLLYEEILEDIPESTKTRIKFKDNMLELVRQGSIRTHMIFEENKRHTVNYATPYGNFLMAIETRKINVEETEECIKVNVAYGLETEGEYLSDSSISICVQSAEK